MTPNSPVSDLIALAERLSALLTEESALLAAAEIRKIAALQPDKAKLAGAFEAQLSRLDRDRAAVANAEPGLRAKLGRVMAKMRDAIAENARRLRAARDANQRIINAIVKAVSEQQRSFDVYTPSGGRTNSLYGHHPVAKSVSLSVDQRL